MRRPPSIGFLYLVLTLVLFVGFFAYLLGPHWWEQGGERRYRSEAAYLRRLAVDGTPEQRARWLGDALELLMKCGDWAEATEVVVGADRDGVSLAAVGLVAITPGCAWAMGFDSARRTPDQTSITLFLRNDDDHERTLSLHFSATRKGAVRVRPVGGEWARHRLQGGPMQSVTIDRVMSANSTQALELQATEGLFDPSTPGALGARLEKIEVSS